MLATLSRVFGFTQLRPGQQRVVEAVLDGRSAAAIFPTGSGKSLCYQLPALHLPHLTLVVSPLLALMQDQLAFLHARGISAASIDSAQSREEASAVMASTFAKLNCIIFSIENYLVAKDMPAVCHSATPSRSLLTLRPLALSSCLDGR